MLSSPQTKTSSLPQSYTPGLFKLTPHWDFRLPSHQDAHSWHPRPCIQALHYSLSSCLEGQPPHTCRHKEDSRAEDNIVLAAVDPPSADAEPSEQEQNGAEDGKDTGGSHNA